MYSGEKWAFLFVYTRPKVIVSQELWHFGVIAWLFQTIRGFCFTDLYSVPQFENFYDKNDRRCHNIHFFLMKFDINFSKKCLSLQYLTITMNFNAESLFSKFNEILFTPRL